MKKLLILIVFISLLSCWKKQDHDVTRPLIPSYRFSGQTIDIDSGEILSGVSIQIRQVHMLYEVTFGTQVVESDSNGNFEFDPIYPGTYYIDYQIGDYWIDAWDKLEIAHKDSAVVIEIPKIFMCNVFSTSSMSTHPAIASNGSRLVSNEMWMGALTGQEPLVNAELLRKYKYNVNHWEFEYYFMSPFNKKNVTGMTYHREVVLACVGPDSLYQLDLNHFTVQRAHKMTQNIKGLCLNIADGHVYSCSQNSIFRHDKTDFSNITEQYTIEANNLRAMAYYKGMYCYDNDRYILRKFDADMNTTASYVLIRKSTDQQVKKVYDMTFSGYGDLWVTEP